MFGSKTLKAALTGTTALIGVAMLMAPTPANAVNVNGAVGQQVLTPGESLFVFGGGDVTSATSAVLDNGGNIATLVQNSATISGVDTGILVTSAGADITQGVTNSGTIFGGTAGIELSNHGIISGGIDNALGGHISGAAGIFVTGTGSNISGLVSNAGDITGSHTAILVNSHGSIGGGISNTGHITANGVVGTNATTGFAGGAGTAIGVTNHGTIAGITNALGKTISGHGGAGGSGITNGGGTGGAGVGLSVTNAGTITAVITNHGTISGLGGAGGNGLTVGGDGGAGTGIFVNSAGSSLTGGIVNDGTITGHGGNGGIGGTSNGAGGDGFGINVINHGTIAGITNNTGGTISGVGGTGVTTGAGIGINVGVNGSVTGGIDNSGSITGTTIGIKNAGSITNVGAAGAASASTGSAGSAAIAINVHNTGTIAGINNVATGTITGTGGAGGHGIAFIGGNGGAGTGINVNGTASAITGGITNGGAISGVGGAGGSGGSIGGNGGAGVGINVSNHGTIASINNVAGGTISGAGGAAGTGGSTGGFTGAGTGIDVTNHGTITGGIVNAGHITGSTHGINVDATSSIGGTTSALTGIQVTGAVGRILGGVNNVGTIAGSGVGISVKAGGNIDTIANNVTVAAHAVTGTGHITGGSTGILVTGAGSAITGGIDNHGVIQDAAHFGINVTAGGVISTVDNAVTVDNDPDALHQVVLATGQITGHTAGINVAGVGSNINGLGVINAGTITGTAGAGISVDSGGDISGGISNNVTLGGVGGVAGQTLATGLITGTTFGVHVASTNTSIFPFVTAHISHISGTINNSGTIHGNQTGIGVTSGGDISGNIVNSGTISGNNKGISVTGGVSSGTFLFPATIASTIAGTIDNSGTISGSDIGIAVDNGGLITGLITNEVGAHITGGTDTAGIRVHGSGSDISGGIHNFGTISGGDGIAVVTSGHISGLITNEAGGHITGTHNGSAGILVTGAGADITVAGGIDNFGTISNTAGGEGSGIAVGNGGHISGVLHNELTGVISGGSTGINVRGAGSNIGGIVTNAGHISGGSNGIAVTNAADISGGIDNTGTIHGGVNGILVSSAKISGGITNEAGGVIDPVAGKAINLVHLTAVTQINIGGGGTVDGSDNSANLATNDPRIVGDVTDDFFGATNRSPVFVNSDFITEGNFTVSNMTVNAGTLTISPTDTLNLQSFTGGVGTVRFGLDSNTAGHFGNIVVATGAADLTDTTLAVKVEHDSTLTNGTALKVITGDGADAPTAAPVNGTLVADNSFIWNFDVVDGVTGGGNVSDLFLQAILAHPIVATPGNQDVFDVLEGLTGTTNPQLQDIIANLNAAGSQQAVSDILEASTPTVNGSDQAASASVNDQTLDLIDNELADLRTGEYSSTGMAAGNMARGIGAWGQAFGAHSDQSERDSVAGYTSNTWGGAVGVDTRNVSDRALVGLAFSYGRTNANSDGVNDTDTNIDNYQAMLYGDFDLAKDTFLNGMAGYTWGNVDETRHHVGCIGGCAGGVTAHGSYNTQQYSAQAEAGRDFAMQGGATLTPSLLARWSDWNPDSYTETGAGGADLHVNGKTLDTFELGGGVKADWSFKNRDGSWLKPQLHAGVRYNLEDTRVEDTTNFTGGGGSFFVPGPNQARTDLNLGAGLKFLTTQRWTLTASYNFDWKSDYTAHSGFLRAGYKF